MLFFDLRFCFRLQVGRDVEGLPDGFDRSDIKKALELFCDTYDENDTQEQWFARIKEIAASLGYAPETKLYRQSPDSYRGHVGDISMFIRVALTGSTNSPDMYEIMQILGRGESLSRISGFAAGI